MNGGRQTYTAWSTVFREVRYRLLPWLMFAAIILAIGVLWRELMPASGNHGVGPGSTQGADLQRSQGAVPGGIILDKSNGGKTRLGEVSTNGSEPQAGYSQSAQVQKTKSKSVLHLEGNGAKLAE